MSISSERKLRAKLNLIRSNILTVIQLSNDSELLTEEEEEEEEKNLDLLYKTGKGIQEYVEDVRKIKAENKKNKDHKKTGNEL